MNAPTPENSPSYAIAAGGSPDDLLSRHQRISHAACGTENIDDLSGPLAETTIAEASGNMPPETETSDDVGAEPSSSRQAGSTFLNQHGCGDRPQPLEPQGTALQPINSLALYDAAAGFPEPSFQDSLTQDLLAGMEGIEFDFLLDDAQLAGSFLPTAPFHVASSMVEISQAEADQATSSSSQLRREGTRAAHNLVHQRRSPLRDGPAEPLETGSSPPFAIRLPSMEPERPEEMPLYISSAHGPQDSFMHSPRPRQVHSIRPWKISAEEYSKVVEEAGNMHIMLPNTFTLPSHRALSRFVEGYFRGFAIHLPFIHGVTFSASSAGLELLFSLAAVGALYRFEPASAYQLYAAARTLVSWRLSQRDQPVINRLTRDHPVTTETASLPATSIDTDTNTERSGPHDQSNTLRLLQAMIVLMAMASWGDRGLISDALRMSSQVAMLARDMEISEPEKLPPPNQPWSEAIKLEERRRTLFAAFVLLNLQSVAFDVPPLLLNREVAVNLPGCTSSWQAPNEAEWSTLRDTYMTPRPFPEKLQMLLSGRGTHAETALSSFGNYVLIHGLLQQILLTRNASEGIPGSRDALSGDFVNRMEAALRAWQESWEATYESTTDPSSPKGPLGFNSTAILRLAYIRLNVGPSPGRRLLLARDAQEIAAAFSNRTITAGNRSPHMDQAVLQCIHALSIPVRVGIAFVARTQTLNWSVQHALCNLECAFLLTQWLEILSEVVQESGIGSLRADERRLVNLVVNLLQETELEDSLNEDQHLAVQIANLAGLAMVLWSKTFNGSHVFDTVRRIGGSLSILALASKETDVA
ncbi:AmdA [Colletotrichum orchidophilum]|uniref:AmdA n=1 Tax=Colletotrichum orchidophilum TaxID=1209926 RepID=A0A1G4B672_9PEZI|nr:AmdA [Colletotrichum orchidophilum]OHE96907.1 AmdA [Colletotrichum orchidophilum]